MIIGVYILISIKDGNKYIGSSNDIERRLQEHRRGKVTSTKNRRPIVLYAIQKCDNLLEARIFEKKYKNSHSSLERAVKKGSVKLVKGNHY